MSKPVLDEYIVVIPAFNESKHVGVVITSLKDCGFNNILVVDDCSNDNTKEIAEDLGTKVIRHSAHQGMGGAIRTGFDYVSSDDKYNYVVTVDADGQHRLNDVMRVALKIRDGGDVVTGQRRFFSKGVSVSRSLFNLFASIVVFMLTGKFLEDVLTGLRCIRIDKLKSLNLKSNGYAICAEMSIETVKNNLKTTSIMVDAVYTTYSSTKAKRVRLIDSFDILKELLVKYCF